MNLTPRQQQVVVFVRNYRNEHGTSPTMQEVADGLSISKVTVFNHVDALEAKGVIRRNKHWARSIEIVGDDENAPLMGAIADAVARLNWLGDSKLAKRLERAAAAGVRHV